MFWTEDVGIKMFTVFVHFFVPPVVCREKYSSGILWLSQGNKNNLFFHEDFPLCVEMKQHFICKSKTLFSSLCSRSLSQACSRK